MGNKIIYQLFKIDKIFYLYDFNSNKILEIEKEEFNVLKKFNGKITMRDLKRNFSRKLIKEINQLKILKQSKFKKIDTGFSSIKDLEKYIQKNAESLVFIVTENCNLRCKYCIYTQGNYYDKRTHLKKDLSLDIAIKSSKDFLSRKIDNKKPPFICFYGGEPLLRWGLINQIIEQINNFYLKEKQFFINSNGTLLTEEKFEFLIKNKVMLRISLDGPEKIHNRNRVTINNKKTFDLIMNNLKKLRQKNKVYFKKYVSISFVISDPRDIPKIKKFFHTNKILRDIPKICSQVNNKSLKNKNLENKIPENIFIKQLKDYISSVQVSKKSSRNYPFNFWWAKYLINIHNREIIPLKIRENIVNSCIPCAHRLVVHPNGDYSFCIQGAESFNVGNFKKGIDTKKIFKILKQTEKILSRKCTSCWCFRFCPICPAFFTINKHLSEKLLAQSCKDIRRNIYFSFIAFLILNKYDPRIFEKISPSEELSR